MLGVMSMSSTVRERVRSDHPTRAGFAPLRRRSVEVLPRTRLRVPSGWRSARTGRLSRRGDRFYGVEVAGRDDRAELEDLLAEVDAVRPYLDLAREIRAAVERFASDDTADVDTLVEAIDAIPQRERARVARSIFDRLPAERQWAILERVFGDHELREALEAERTARLAERQRFERRDAVVRSARAAQRLDLTAVAEGQTLVIGLFRSGDVRAALARGRASQVCVREVVLRATAEPGELRVIDDVFNPRRGYFVTSEYDERTWKAERLGGHAVVRVGSLTDLGPGAAPVLEPALYPGARVDVSVDGEVREGQLHLGFAVLDEKDVFLPPS